MKQSRMSTYLYMILVLCILLIACSNDSESVGKGKSNEESETNENANAQNKDQSEEKDEQDQTDEQKQDGLEKQEPEYYISEETATVLPLDDANEKIVLLTIDDVPDAHAVEMAHTLKDLGVGAIFFANGHFINDDEGADKLKEIHDMGFLIGNHTNTHPVLPELTEKEQTDEIVSVSDRIEEIIGERPKFFRAPHGMNSDHSKAVAKEENMTIMNWTYGYDYFDAYTEPQALAEAMITGEGPEAGVDYSLLKPGANLLMHDRNWTNEALKDIVEGLQNQGYEIVDPHLIETS
ncbi:polysaccharide deacetylase family protein [Oceanobacillus sp. 1P07AA]|uniref:polysaccharide deacetylase family protein n=1 Tax=Oceanobacillus sp. 1P07AA TaxID=3132293 RepID=UPI0039A5E9F3